ncbi:hypothetical protein R1sor_012197 [Riccia sorocarpa]|uniref:FCP1 homology domain-containing protein n=1 Tax=Riccia sorocarpa TaxID=122646 RepID=A0ABD3I3Y5_9MARC
MKRERAESVEAINEVAVVEKERSSEALWLIKRYFKVPLCKEWLLSFDGAPKRDCSATVQGQRIILTEELFREVFFIQEELNPSASQQPFPKHVMRIGLEDWFSRYDEKAKRYLAEDCIHEPSPKEDLNDDMQVILHEDVGSSKRRAPLRRTDVLEPEMQQRLLHALQTEDQMDVRLNAMKAELVELERLVAEEMRLLEETAHRRKEEERRLEELGANVYRQRACLREFHLMIWTSRPRAIIDRILRFVFKSKKISFDLAYHECFIFGSKTSRPVTCKDFDILYEHNICARDVLIVEDDVAKINTNNVMNALVPRRWDLSVETPSSSFLMDHLLPFLTTWRSSVKGTVEFVEETRQWATLPWVEEPVEALMKWWGPDVKKTKTWTDVLFRSCTYEECKSLREIWTSITVRQKSRAESVAPVEGATPLESAAPVESTTPVLSAAPVAIDQSSAPISSVVDVSSVPSTS